LKDGDTMKKNAKKASDTFDWSRADAMTDEEIHAAALSDPDAQPLTQEQLAQMKPFSPAKRVRMKLRLTQEEFAKRYGIPLSTLRDWEQYRTDPDQAARSYIAVIEAFPNAIAKALSKRRQHEHAE
jgi:putative transcriptional regulator